MIKNYAAPVLLLLFAVFIFSQVYIKKDIPFFSSNFQPASVTSPPTDHRPTPPSDALEKLNAGAEPPAQLARLLTMYANPQVPGSDDVVKKYLQNPDTKLQQAALVAAGSYESIPTTVYAEALQSPHSDVRQGALRALGRRVQPDRLALVNIFLKRPDLAENEWIIAKIAQQILEPDLKKKQAIVDDVLAKIRTLPPEGQIEGYAGLIFNSNEVEKLKAASRSLLIEGGHDDLVAMAFGYEVKHDLEWLKQEIANIPMRANRAYQTAVAAFLINTCPSAWRSVYALLVTPPLSKSKIEEACR